ncbi:hypothetical protein IMZ48_41570 [Candidatus Bathyarchaeota archaeon]|nr:hypothetical protein [Candidatus Bathyarchaeota archaeon]
MQTAKRRLTSHRVMWQHRRLPGATSDTTHGSGNTPAVHPLCNPGLHDM